MVFLGSDWNADTGSWCPEHESHKVRGDEEDRKRASVMAPRILRIKVLVTNPGDWSTISSTSMVEGEDQLQKVIL